MAKNRVEPSALKKGIKQVSLLKVLLIVVDV